MGKKKKDFKPVPVGAEATPTINEFKRSRWKHFTRWLVFGFAVFLYISLMYMTFSAHVLHGQGFSLKEVVVYIMCTILMVPILPSVVLEVDSVKTDDDSITFNNLLFRKKEKWENLVSFSNPIYLKFAIVKSKSFFYLLNRRDLPNFEMLVERIRMKTDKLIE